MTKLNGSDELLTYIISQSNSGSKNWFGFSQQRITGIYLAYEIAKLHADKIPPEQIVEYVDRLNTSIYKKLIKGETI
jgi:hypothetical protein